MAEKDAQAHQWAPELTARPTKAGNKHNAQQAKELKRSGKYQSRRLAKTAKLAKQIGKPIKT